MGAHTVSDYNTIMVTDNAYSWLRRRQMELFNNKYYKVMAERKSKIWDQCIGTMDDKVPSSQWTARTHILIKILKKPNPWATAENPGHLRWNMNYIRGPNCFNGTFGYKMDKKTWNMKESLKTVAQDAGFESAHEFCCNERNKNCSIDNSCHSGKVIYFQKLQNELPKVNCKSFH